MGKYFYEKYCFLDVTMNVRITQTTIFKKQYCEEYFRDTNKNCINIFQMGIESNYE